MTIYIVPFDFVGTVYAAHSYYVEFFIYFNKLLVIYSFIIYSFIIYLIYLIKFFYLSLLVLVFFTLTFLFSFCCNFNINFLNTV